MSNVEAKSCKQTALRLQVINRREVTNINNKIITRAGNKTITINYLSRESFKHKNLVSFHAPGD